MIYVCMYVFQVNAECNKQLRKIFSLGKDLEAKRRGFVARAAGVVAIFQLCMYVQYVCMYVCMWIFDSFYPFSESFALRQQDIWKEIASFSSLTVGKNVCCLYMCMYV